MARFATNSSIDTLIFDLGDVLFTWSAETKTSVPPKTLRNILESAVWFDYERGRLSEVEVYGATASKHGLQPHEVKDAFQAARNSLAARSFMIDLIRQLKSGRKVYAMSNISAPDWEVLRGKPSDWDLFDHVFTSAAVGERKPDIGFYRHVLETTGSDPSRTVFVDDKLDNVLVARSFGIHGIVYDTFENVQRSLLNLCGNPIERGQLFLKANARNHLSYTSTGVTIQENFAQLLILEATNDPTLVEYTKYDGAFNFFRGEGELTTAVFPCDVDTTSIGFTCSDHLPVSKKHQIMDDIFKLRNHDNILQVYFDPTRPRIDPVVCVNVLTLFHSYSRGYQLRETFDWVERVLKHRAYSQGTRYYEPAEAFLFFLSRLLAVSPSARQRLGPMYGERCRERIGLKGDALALAMRVICCSKEGIDASIDALALRELQDIDGGWSDGWFYKYGSNGVLIANRGLTTALAINALETNDRLQEKLKDPVVLNSKLVNGELLPHKKSDISPFIAFSLGNALLDPSLLGHG
ncbi:HAD-like protein [Marasmius fiardii PR-910]|nr:HAD-like protein [Marasmius fiardii PR-910]